MLDRKFITDHAEQVKLNCTHRGVSWDIDRLVELEAVRRGKLQEVRSEERRVGKEC